MSGIEAKMSELREAEQKYQKSRRGALMLGAVTGGGWLLYLYKLSQTSEIALRYSRRAQAESGTWLMVLFVLTVIAAIGALSIASKRKKLEAQRAEVKRELRDGLDGADDATRSRIESQLRELGA